MIEALPWTAQLLLGGAGAGVFFCGGVGLQRFLSKRPRTDYSTFIEQMSEGYYHSSLDGTHLMVNPALVKMNGYETEQEFLSSIKDLCSECYVDPDRCREFRHLLQADGKVENFVSEMYRHKTRERIWITESARLVRDKLGQPLHYEGTVRECTDTIKKLELEKVHQKFSDQVPGILIQSRWTKSGEFTIPYSSRGFYELFGENATGVDKDASTLLKLLHPEDYGGFLKGAEESAATQSQWSHEFRVQREDRADVWIDMKARPEIEADGSVLWHGFLMDVTDKKNAQQKIHNLAFYDTLTKLPNRRMMLDQLKLVIDRSDKLHRTGSLLFVDLDNFKRLNETQGHGVGDSLLQEMASRLEYAVGGDGVVGRLGGDEFVILLTKLSNSEQIAERQYKEVGNRILDAIAEPFQFSQGSFQTSCSIGVATFGGGQMAPYEVLKNADLAMYAAKAAGKNLLRTFDESMLKQLDQTIELASELRLALEMGELELKYQPQVDCDGSIIGAEALIRWTHESRGVISPGVFIPIAEETGLILPLTDWVLQQAFDTLVRWQRHPDLQQLTLSINVSAQQFHEPGFADRVRYLSEHYSVDTSRLIIELTEYVFYGDMKLVKKVMDGLKECGVRFSLDDFGTGYSSLIHLRDLPFDELKIDGAFVCDLEENKSDQAIIRSIIALARALKLSVVAEWVETAGQHEFLKVEGCDLFQGYLHGPAVPLEQIEHSVLDEGIDNHQPLRVSAGNVPQAVPA